LTASREVLFQGRILTLEIHGGRYEVVRHAPAVAVLVRDDAGRVLLVRQVRFPLGVATLELPAGLIDPGESPAEAAARELAEEAGLAGELSELAAAYVSPGFTDERVHLFAATDPRPVAAACDPEEDLQVVWLDAREAWQRLASGETPSSMVTLLGLRFALGAP
jgi:8-oxo-dGTP pyrophosphatase MutT (NUDIX family)